MSDAAPAERRRQQIVLETASHRIEGMIELPPEGYRSRLSDQLNRETPFISLTSAQRVPLGGGPASQHAFLAVAKAAVIVAYPHGDESS